MEPSVPGLVPAYLYEQGRLDDRLPFADLQRQAHVNERARHPPFT